MSATILDGKKLAETVRAEVATGVAEFVAAHGRPPGLEVVLVGEDPASQVYTRNKQKASTEVGIRGKLHTLPASTTEGGLLALLDRLNASSPSPSRSRSRRSSTRSAPTRTSMAFIPSTPASLHRDARGSSPARRAAA